MLCKSTPEVLPCIYHLLTNICSHSGELANAEYETYETFNLQVPVSVPGVPDQFLNPSKSWSGSASEFTDEVTKLGKLFVRNFSKYESEATAEVKSAAPVV